MDNYKLPRLSILRTWSKSRLVDEIEFLFSNACRLDENYQSLLKVFDEDIQGCPNFKEWVEEQELNIKNERKI